MPNPVKKAIIKEPSANRMTQSGKLPLARANSTRGDHRGDPNPIQIRISDHPAYECGAVLFAYLAFPGAKEEEVARGDVHRALCRIALTAASNADPPGGFTAIEVKPAYLLLSEGDARKILRTFDRRLLDRRDAARMAIPFLQEVESGKVPKLPEGIQRLSIQQMAKFIAAQRRSDEAVNVESRVWAPSLPVIHLAVALELLLKSVDADDRLHLGPDVLMWSADFISRWVEQAQRIESLVERSPQLVRAATQLVRFRLA